MRDGAAVNRAQAEREEADVPIVEPDDGKALPEEPVAADPLLRIRRPSDRTRVGEVEMDGPERVRDAVTRAARVQKDWAGLSPRDRMRRMGMLRVVMGRRAPGIADRIVAETGKPEGEALSEVLLAMRHLRFLERAAPRVLGPARVSTGPMPWMSARVEREPAGVVAVIGTWSSPFILAMEPVLTALASGNAAVLKPSEHTPFTGDVIRELVAEAGLPEGLVEIVQGRTETGVALASARIDHLHFIGSRETGRVVLAEAAARGLPVTLGVGGKDPALVLEDADLDLAARAILRSAFRNAGQGSFCTGSVYAVEAVYEPLLRRLVRGADALRVGSAGNIEVGPMVRDDLLDGLESRMRDAIGRGARILAGGDRVDPASNVFLPTILGDVPPTARILHDETPGPILPVVQVTDEEDAVAAVSEVPMRLFVSVWTRDVRRGRRLARRIPCGVAGVNEAPDHWAPAGLPLGAGSFGRMRGNEGLRDFTRTRSLLVRRGWPPWDPRSLLYGPRGRRLLRALLGREAYGGLRGLGAAVVRAFQRADP